MAGKEEKGKQDSPWVSSSQQCLRAMRVPESCGILLVSLYLDSDSISDFF